MNVLFVLSTDYDREVVAGVGRVTQTLIKYFEKIGVKTNVLILSNNYMVSKKEYNFYLPNLSSISDAENVLFLDQLLKDLEINFIINQSGIYKEKIDFLHSRSNKKVKLFTVHHNCIKCLQQNYVNTIMGSSYEKIMRVFNFKWAWKLLLYRNKRNYGYNFKNAITKSEKLVLLAPVYIPELKSYINSWAKEKVTAIYNPLPFEIQNDFERNKENRLVFVGRIEYTQKQCNLLLPIWEKISQKFPDWHFDIVGDGTKLTKLTELSQANGLKKIHFHGYTDPRPFLVRAKILCMTSSFEGHGMVLVEAQAYGVVPIAFNSFSSLPIVIEDGYSGIAIEPFDVDSYILKISELIHDEVKRNKMARQAQKSLEKFLPETIVQEWLELYKSLD